MTGYLKPQTGMYEYLLTKHNLDPKECLFIDDQKENVSASQKLGIPALQFQEHHVHNLEEYLRQMYLV
jgi:HAD superfamily hydrolase (TIGR01509 family)